jgi:uncharacterized protein YaeQ
VATVYNFEIDLADNDRSVYENLALRVAQHPSESEDFLWTRVLAFALEYHQRLEFSRGGLSDVDEPPLAIRDLTGRYESWIEIGLPDADRLHRAAKAAPRVVVYAHRDPMQWWSRLDRSAIHRAETIEFWAVDRALIAALAGHLERRTAFALSVTDRDLFLSIGSDTLTGVVRRLG